MKIVGRREEDGHQIVGVEVVAPQHLSDQLGDRAEDLVPVVAVDLNGAANSAHGHGVSLPLLGYDCRPRDTLEAYLGVQLADLLASERAEHPRAQISHRHGPHPGPDEPAHGQSDLGQHASDNVLASLVYHELHHRPAGGGADQPEAVGARDPVVQRHAGAQPTTHVPGDGASTSAR